MQYKIPLQIENEDTIFLGLSLRQLAIIMGWGGVAYGVFKYIEPRLGGTVGLIFAGVFVSIGIGIALVRVAEMTFFPTILNTLRLHLNAKVRPWSQGTDSYPEIEIGVITQSTAQKALEAPKTLEEKIGNNNDDFREKLKHL